MTTIAHNIYIHVPFCMAKCRYCAFFSQACANPDWNQYEKNICDEIIHWAKLLGCIDVPTIFFGGGTPSLMPSECFGRILDTIRKHFNVFGDTEITLESNPGTIDNIKLKDFYNLGMNRLSVGVQSLNDEKLKFLGRIHSADDAVRLIAMAQDMGLRVSGDFIYGLPGETIKDIIQTCNQINNIGLTHCSMYELTIEKNTPFGKMNLDMPDNKTMADMYMAIPENLRLPRYEISNYAMPGQECKHNQNVWDGEPYIGIGNGAAGRIFVNNTWYEQMGNHVQWNPLDTNTRAIEKVITGMRTVRGCRLTHNVRNVIDTDWINAHPELVQIKNNRVATTDAGMIVLDDIIVNMVK